MKEIKYAKVTIVFYSGQIMEAYDVRNMRAVWRKVSKTCKCCARWSNEYLHKFGKYVERVRAIEYVYPDGRAVLYRNFHALPGAGRRAITQ